MRNLTVLEAYKEALYQGMEADPSVFVIGEDVRIGGPFVLYKGLVEKFGEDRVVNTPISEIAYTGLAVGAAMSGKRPIVDFQFGDFVFCAMDQIVNQAAKMCYMSEGSLSVPMVICLPVGANRRGAQHAQCTESIFMNVPGLRIVAPSSPYDAKGLMIAAIRDNNPVLVYQHKLLYGMGKGRLISGLEGDVPEEAYSIPFGSARICREGKDVTIVATQLMLVRSLEAAELLQQKGISAEVIDPRTLCPLDAESIAKSVARTGKLVVVEECPVFGGWGNEAIADVVERLGTGVSALRIGERNTPIPYASELENKVIPTTERIVEEIESFTRRKHQ